MVGHIGLRVKDIKASARFYTAALAPLGHVAFKAKDHAAVDAFYAAGIKAGGKDNGKPGLRPDYGPKYYGAFLIDLDGNNVEAVCNK